MMPAEQQEGQIIQSQTCCKSWAEPQGQTLTMSAGGIDDMLSDPRS